MFLRTIILPILISTLEKCLCAVNYNSSYFFSYSASGNYNTTSFDVQPNHIAAIGFTGTKYDGLWIKQNTYAYDKYKSTISSTFHQIKSFSANKDANQGFFIVFDASSLKLYTKNFGTVQNWYTVPVLFVTKIINSCFGASVTHVLMLTRETVSGIYRLHLLVNKVQTTSIILRASSRFAHDKMLFLNDTLYLSFQSYI